MKTKKINYIIIKICLLIIIGILAIITPENNINKFHLILYFSMFIYTTIQIIISLKKKKSIQIGCHVSVEQNFKINKWI